MLQVYAIRVITKNPSHQANRFLITDGEKGFRARNIDEVVERAREKTSFIFSDGRLAIDHLDYNLPGDKTILNPDEVYKNYRLTRQQIEEFEEKLFGLK